MEKRTVEISLATAKEWYKGDNQKLRNLALQAFNETELKEITCVKSWEEFCEKYNRKNDYYINNFSEITIVSGSCNYPRDTKNDKNLLKTKQDAEALLALIQLKRLRDQWWEVLNWKPDYTDNKSGKSVIILFRDKFTIERNYLVSSFLAFPTEEIAEDFLKCFKDLIEKAKEFI